MTDLQSMSERELYRLAFEISEELVQREAERLTQYLSVCAESKKPATQIVGRYEIARPTPVDHPGYSVKVA